MRAHHAITVLLAISLGGACPKAAGPARVLVTADGTTPLAAGADPVADAGGTRHDVLLDGRVRLIGAKLPADVEKGARFEAVLWFLVEGDVADEAKVFVHGTIPGAEIHQLGADHRPLAGKVAARDWHVGDVLVDRFVMTVPLAFPGDAFAVHAGLYDAERRWPASPKSAHDGKDRVPLGTVVVKGGAAPLVVATAKRRSAPIRIDGVLDEPDWTAAAVLGPFIAYDGRQVIENATTARIVWDDTSLWVAFEAKDKDAHTPYTKRDDPLYDSEAVEIFVDADGDKDVYVELQAAPNDLHFDAAFAGGRRKNMETSYDVAYESKTVVDGTLNDDSDVDRGYISEWRIPIAELRDVPSPPKPGDTWKINLFRLDRIRRGGKVVKSEASAWSTPLSGDFHNLDRFGTLRFE